MSKATFALRTHNPDVLTCIANLSNDEVFTPPEFANQMLDALEQSWSEAHEGAVIWEDPNVKFLDPFTKSGVFLREIVTRLTAGLSGFIPNLDDRVDHILTKQVYGIGITELTSLLARRSLYCSKFANGPHSIAATFETEEGNIWFERTEHAWIGGTKTFLADPLSDGDLITYANRRCKYCGAAEAEYARSEQLETHAYAFIHTDDIKARIAELFGDDMQFDVIIGNPPYQLNDGGFGSSAAPIYQRFVEQAKALDPRMLTLVIPARWYAGGKGLSEFRSSMLSDSRIRVLHDFPDTSDVFPGVNNRGGICYFLWDRDYAGDVTVYTHEKGEITSAAKRPLLEPGLDTFIRYNEGVAILKKVVAVEGGGENELVLPAKKRFSELVSSRKPFGLDTTFNGRLTQIGNDLRVYRNGGICYIPRDQIKSGTDLIDKCKLFVPYASPGNDDYPHLVLSKPLLAEAGDVATETYLAIGPFKDTETSRNAATYMGTQFFRFMLSLLRVSQHVTRNVYAFVPLQDFSKSWSDDDLAAKYGLTEDDRAFMGRFVKPVSWAGDYK
ncbi:restriction endonuclease [Arthrobacter sp. PGP41]|uniref:Eco57I restriction-modification methylase domain-containing protein n=1 Tax=Arthrobacter sp. PGP41 TaxID=2079227 RepID=UPI000CDBA91E|nr:Eco57I restriction-modification methylase domain-containing protein [Arthrobacter sp. PGP41]AUZ33872.1 restriction endonuclease [Arthrobacter sp. PGP41]